MADFTSWKNSVLGKTLDTDGIATDNGMCSQVPESWGLDLYPGVPLRTLFPSVKSAKDMFTTYSPKYFQAIKNDHSDPNQLPQQGDVLIFGATPAKGFTNAYANPDGHCGVVDSASPSGYTLVQQNAPNNGQSVNDTSYPWNYRPALGWLHPLVQPPIVPVPPVPVASGMVGKTLHLPTTNPNGSADTVWHVYNETGPYDLPHAIHALDPAKFGGLSYPILADRGNGVYVIATQDYGRVAIWTTGTNATIS